MGPHKETKIPPFLPLRKGTKKLTEPVQGGRVSYKISLLLLALGLVSRAED